ncbi:MAG: hypothetical protein JNM67_05925 [Bacteroidetes bacterium]|nr:hypothetical protein [Bacteroidota bacterium]
MLDDTDSIPDKYVLIGILLYILFIVLCARFVSINADEIAVITLFRKPLFSCGSGLLVVCVPFDYDRYSSLPEQLLFPSEEEKKIRITHGFTIEKTNDPLDSRQTTFVQFVFTYKIVDGVLFMQHCPVGFSFREQIREMLISNAVKDCAELPLSLNLTKERREEIDVRLTNELSSQTRDWGIAIVRASLKEIELSEDIISAQQNLSISSINVHKSYNEAQGNYINGMSAAKIHEAFMYAKAEGLNKIAEELNIDEKILVLQLSTLENMFRKSNGNVHLYGNNFQQMLDSVLSMFQSKK